MSTNDVPGAVESNNDELHCGCWAEHEDGSLILVVSTENNKVYYDIFDMSKEPVVYFRDAMPVGEFMVAYSHDHADRSKYTIIPDDLWTWHDKTPFPMSRVVKAGAQDGTHLAAADTLTAAERIRTVLKARAKRVTPGMFTERVEGVTSAFAIIRNKLGRAFSELGK